MTPFEQQQLERINRTLALLRTPQFNPPPVTEDEFRLIAAQGRVIEWERDHGLPD